MFNIIEEVKREAEHQLLFAQAKLDVVAQIEARIAEEKAKEFFADDEQNAENEAEGELNNAETNY